MLHIIIKIVFCCDIIRVNTCSFCRYFDGNRCPSLIAKPKIFILQVYIPVQIISCVINSVTVYILFILLLGLSWWDI